MSPKPIFLIVIGLLVGGLLYVLPPFFSTTALIVGGVLAVLIFAFLYSSTTIFDEDEF
ncbi:MAG: hypothetical protein WBA17_00915 [Saprospiraceae bacterium]